MADVLRDVLVPGLRVAFCGTAPGTASARARAYYAGPGNAFWKALHQTGLTPVELAPAEFARLPEFGIGLTDICKVLYGSDEEVGTVEFDVDGLHERVAEAEPGVLAFNGKNAAQGALDGQLGSGPRKSGSAGPRSGSCRRRRAGHGGTGTSGPGRSWPISALAGTTRPDRA